MINAIPYYEFIENKISSICLENKNILSRKISFDEESDNLIITLIYNGFTVKLKYGDTITEDYSFLEDDNMGKSLIPKFIFPFSEIEYSVYDIHNAVEDSIFRTYAFHCLYDEASVGKALETVISFINRNEEKIRSISGSQRLQKELNESFESGLKIASKKITTDKIKENPKKYLSNHDIDMYYLRIAETAFTSHITKNTTRELQNFYRKQTKKNKLLPFEKRYIDYLYKNDFKNTDADAVESVKKNQKISSKIEKSNSFIYIISLIFALALDILIGSFIEKRIEKNYLLLEEVTLDNIFIIVFLTIGFYLVLNNPLKRLFMRKKEGYDSKSTKLDIKTNAILAVAGVVIIIASGTFSYFDYQKNVGLGEKDIYYCQKLGKAEILPYDDVKLYLIEGTYYGNDYSDTDDDKTIAVVVNDDYENCFVSEYLTEIDMKNSYRDSLDYAGKFKSIEDFNDNFLVG